jgi:biopolymer transport protein ExbD
VTSGQWFGVPPLGGRNRRSRHVEKEQRSGEEASERDDPDRFLLGYCLFADHLFLGSDKPGEKKAQAQTEKTPTVNLRGSDIFFNDKQVSLEELEARLAALDLHDQEGSKKVILLESTRETPYGSYFQTLAVISASGGVVALVEEETKK